MSERLVIGAASVPRLARGVKLRFDQVREAWILLGPERVLMPDPIAVAILQRCTGAAAVAAVVDALAAEYQADRAQVERDVIQMLQDLADKGLLAA